MKLFAPSIKVCHESNLKKFENFIKIKYKKEFKFYSDFWQWTINYPDKFWSSLADYFNLEFKKKKNSKILRRNSKFWLTQFFYKYQVNYYHLIEKNISNDLAIHFIGENGYEEKITYKELNQKVNSLSSYYLSLKIKKGDVIVGYLPNIPDTIIAFLAAAKIGAIWSSCSSDFGSKAVIDRFFQLKPKLRSG